MEKRLTRTAMFFSVGFVFMVAFAAGAFFFGLKIGTDKAETKYEMKQLKSQSNENAVPYQQQDLVSFYHTVFLPYREFQTEWIKSINKLQQGQLSEPVAIFKGLGDLANRKSKEVSSFDMQKSPLLGQAQASMIRSLEQFEQAAGKAAVHAKTLKNKPLIDAIEKETSYQKAVNSTLDAQQAYFNAMLKWGATVNPDIPRDFTSPNIMEINQWKKLPLIVKNKLMADHLQKRNQLAAFYPQDLTSRVDEFIQTGQQSEMKVRSISAIAELMVNTKAVRSGDFTASKAAQYEKETLPQLPFFYAEAE
ncbi:hypothetical protein [Paenibacillus sp. NPDC058174]|uniref:hypothetical protein n=1 Tax=Paenibacillus sp. NPDC058174 TaxID=3346366 RepID=UPI0036DA2108